MQAKKILLIMINQKNFQKYKKISKEEITIHNIKMNYWLFKLIKMIKT